MNINLSNDEILSLIDKVLGKNFELLYLIRDNDDLNSVHIRLLNQDTREKVLINFHDYHIEVLCNDVEIIEKLQKEYVDYISEKYDEIGKQKAELTQKATQIAEKIKDTLINALYNEGINGIQNLIKQTSNLSLANALDFARCGNHTAFIKMDNPYFRKDRTIKIGDVYVADLNPVVDAEYGGVRSVVVIGYDKDKANYVCVPCTSNRDGGFDLEYKTDKNLYAVTDKVKIISPIRLRNYKGHITKEKLEQLKGKVEDSYALFNEIETYGNFHSNISYQQTIDKSKTIDQLALLYPITKPSKQVIVDVVTQYLPTLEKRGYKISKRFGNMIYKTNTNYKNNNIITINPDFHGQPDVNPAIVFDFSKFHVKKKNTKTNYWEYDRDFTVFYQKYMLEHNPCYYIHVIKYICDIQRMFYRKKMFTSVLYEDEYIAQADEQIKEQFKNLGIDYQGDFDMLVMKGSQGFDLSKLNYQSQLDKQDNKETTESQNNEIISEDEKE